MLTKKQMYRMSKVSKILQELDERYWKGLMKSLPKVKPAYSEWKIDKKRGCCESSA